MTKISVIENDGISLWYHPDTKIVHHQIHKFISGKVMRDAFTKGAELLEQHRACKWLSDDRDTGATTPDDKEWTATVWVPKVLKAGWKYWALVMPDKVVASMNVKRLKDEFAKSGVTVQTFSDPESGLKWLESL